jgi:PncC family amidohydrolase
MRDAARFAQELARLLAEHQLRLVLVESCTAGEASSQLGRIPGISHWWCGGWIAYRPDSKVQWLKVPAKLIEEHSAESLETTAVLAEAALEATPEADVSGAITGHFGPGAPQIWMASFTWRSPAEDSLCSPLGTNWPLALAGAAKSRPLNDCWAAWPIR